jgi:hypothetical protein
LCSRGPILMFSAVSMDCKTGSTSCVCDGGRSDRGPLNLLGRGPAVGELIVAIQPIELR